ncbi:hypothetical protein J1N10_13660 [Carboxylicivirga sp. A043]|uniref:hypothetical protein n=1 Tax=Carboxylicivirga litoralis TaxID=2816963 RepID=UPI0021CB4E62|nr:hypothetical protein [Carboxylicivirga sp. A043]MCU4157031.1 hypothetical protein [Carboxylicivirga sp. A043]
MESNIANKMSTDIYTRLDVSSDKEFVIRLKTKVNDWANNIPHHPFKNLGDNIKVRSVNKMPCYTVSVETQLEKRDKRYNETPYTGGSLPERTIYDISQVNVWDEALKSVTNFTNINYNYEKNGSQFIKDCSRCGAKGYIACQSCGGAGTWKCSNCGGTGQTTCTTCNGDGKKECYSCRGSGTITEDKYCYQCGGTGRDKADRESGSYSLGGHCSYCGGAGRNKETKSCTSCGGRGYDTCYNCSGRGKVSCRKCSGEGYITCSACGGKGRETCPTCLGAKQLMEYIQIKQNFRSKTNQNYLVDSTVSKLFPEFISNKNNLPRINLFNTTKNSLSTNDAPQGTLLDGCIEAVIERSKNDRDSYEKILFQELNIIKINTWVLEYSFNGHIYQILFHGSNYEIIQGKSPITEFQKTIYSDAQSAIHKKSYRKARKLLKKCEDINDPRQADKVSNSLFKVEDKIEAAYRFGNSLAYRMAFLIFGLLSYVYYKDINYVFNWFDFVNNPTNFLHDIHPWAMTLVTSFFILVFTRKTDDKSINLFGYKPNAPMRFALGFLTNLIYASLITSIFLLLNFTGLTFIISFIAKVVLWIIGIIIGLIVLVYQIIAWFFGLFF